jgi:hypothetical protein
MLENNIPIADSAIAVIPGEYFRWRARVQFVESFQTRADAVSYAFQYGCNLIVERSNDDGPLFDVLQDPDRSCTSGLNLELVETKDFLVEPEAAGWTILMFSSIYELSRRSAAALTRIYNRQVAQSVRYAANRCQRAHYPEALRRSWDFSRSMASKLAQRSAAAAENLYWREAAPRLHRTAIWYRQSDFEGRLCRAWNRSYSTARGLASQLAASARTLYITEIAPLIRQASSGRLGSPRQDAFRRAR